MKTITIEGTTWVKGFLYFGKPFLTKEELMNEYEGKSYQEGYMKLSEIENNETVSFIYPTIEDLKEGEI